MKKNLALAKSSIRLCSSFLKAYKVKIIALAVLCVISGGVPTINSVLLQNIINLIESFAEPQVDTLSTSIIYWAIIYVLWSQGFSTLWRIYDYIYLKTVPYIKGQILEELYNYVQYHSDRFFQANLAGHIAHQITEAARSFEMIVSILAEKIIRKIAGIIFVLIALSSVHHVFAIIFFFWTCIVVGISILCSNKLSKHSVNYASNKSTVAGNIIDSIVNISVVRMFTSHKFEREYLNVRINRVITSEQTMQFFMLKLRYIQGLFCSIMIFTMIYYLALLCSQMVITIGNCVLVLTLSINVCNDLWDLTQEIGDMIEDIGAFNQGMSLIIPYIVTDSENATTLKLSIGEIIFKNVTFKYNNNLFQNESIIIPGKQKVGLVGFSGSGKTTFVNLITRLSDVDMGEILIDGQNISHVTQDSLRSNISIIPQEPVLFHRTIMENIRYGKKEASQEEVIQAAKAAHIHEFIMGLPQGYDSLCGERGNNLSGGQRQRIIIARAILKNAPILILDEATSSLDSETEHFIQESLRYLMQGKTVVVIAHRLLTLLNMDRILVLDKGSIVEDGSHEELLHNSKLYNKLWELQFKSPIIMTKKLKL